MVTTIYFVRHAEPNYENHDDMSRELSDKGLKDRRLVTDFLMDKEIDAVLSSPYKRAVDTVREFADAKGLEIKKIEDFRERKVESEWIEDFVEFCKKQWNDFEYKLSDGECLNEVQKRNISALNHVLEEYSGKNVVIGSHGTALSTIINYFDSTFGLWWNGQSFVSTSYRCPEDYQEPYSLLWERIESLYAEELKTRYAELRNSVLSLSNMFTQFERFMDVIGLELYAEDLTVYTGIPSGNTNNIKQIRNYIRDRLVFTDEEFNNMGNEVEEPSEPTEKTLTSINATYNGEDVTVGTELTDLVGNIVVKANYSDGTSQTVTGYELSGSIVEGSNTITVTYQGLTTTFTVVGFVELVDDGIDYTLNPLENVATYTNSTYDGKTGAVKEVTNEFRTDKFTLQNGMYSLSIKDGTYPAIFIWDENDNFIESIEVVSTSLLKNFTPLPNYKYALKVYNPTVKDDTTFTLMPVDNRETQVDTFSIDLSQYTFGKGGTGAFEISLTEVFAKKGISYNNIVTKLKSANYFTVYLGSSMGVKLDTSCKTEVMFLVWCYNSVDYILSTTSFASLDEANNWLSTNKPTLTFNG